MRSALAALALGALGCALRAAVPAVALDSPAWRLESEADGIALYSCRVEGTGIVPIKAVMTIPGSIEEVSAVLEDAPRRGEWISHFGSSALLERVDDYDQTEYLRMKMPWPFVDRTSLVRVRISVSPDKKEAVIAGESVSCCARADLPELVRSRIYASTFQMRDLGGKVAVAALVFVDPRGYLPQWVVNLYTTKVARRTLEGLRRQVARGLYTDEVLKAMHRRILNYKAKAG